jgi:hypothetical protein
MLHRNAAQAAEDGPTDFSSGPPILALPMELGADQNIDLTAWRPVAVGRSLVKS